jgi:hypothetical protein
MSDGNNLFPNILTAKAESRKGDYTFPSPRWSRRNGIAPIELPQWIYTLASLR